MRLERFPTSALALSHSCIHANFAVLLTCLPGGLFRFRSFRNSQLVERLGAKVKNILKLPVDSELVMKYDIFTVDSSHSYMMLNIQG